MDFIVDETTPRVEQPEDITIQLKPHQLAMIHQMTDLESPERKKINSMFLQAFVAVPTPFPPLPA